MNHTFDDYIKYLFSYDNPVYYTVIFIIILILIIRTIYVKIYLPKKEILEKEVKLANAKAMALFAELDPNPLISLNSKDEIIQHNDAAEGLIKYLNHSDISFEKLFPGISIKEIIDKEKELNIDSVINGRYYTIAFKGIKDLDIVQVYFSDFTERKVSENKLIESEGKLRQLSFYLQDQLEEEKHRIGLELHDSIGQNLMFLKMKINAANSQENENSNSEDITNTIDNTITEVRNIIFNLKPRVLEDIGLHAAVESLIEHLNKYSKIKGSFYINGNPIRLTSKSELYLFRIIQETLNNIQKHSQANEYIVQLVYNKNLLKVTVSDDGIGISEEIVNGTKSGGNGLFNISERIKHINGKLFIETSENEGTIFLFEIPLEEN